MKEYKTYTNRFYVYISGRVHGASPRDVCKRLVVVLVDNKPPSPNPTPMSIIIVHIFEILPEFTNIYNQHRKVKSDCVF